MAERTSIKNFQEGMALSPYTGFAIIKGLDIWNNVGICQPVGVPTLRDYDGIASNITPDSDGIIGMNGLSNSLYYTDSKEVFDSSGDSTGFNTASGGQTVYNLHWWKGYVIAVTTGGIWCYNNQNTTWTDLDVSNDFNGYSPVLHFIDDSLYLGWNNYIARLKEDTDFDPTDAATYTYTAEALELPEDYSSNSLVSFGNKMYIGTSSLGNTATIFPWDGYSVSFYIPIHINEDDVNFMVVSAGQLYIQAGSKGNWYYSNGSSVALFKEFPPVYLYDGTNTGVFNFVPQAVAVVDDIIYFGATTQIDADGNNILDQVGPYSGVWALDTREQRLSIAFKQARGYTDAEMIDYQITDIFLIRDSLYVGWYIKEQDGTEHAGLEYEILREKGIGSLYGGDEAYLISNYYQMGTSWRKHTIAQPEVHLAEELVADEDNPPSIKVYYRRHPNESWTLHDTLDTVGESHFVMNDITDVVNIQFKVVLNGDVKLLKILL